MWFVPDGCQAVFNGEVVVDLIPIPGMAHVRKIEPFVSDVCHSRNRISNVGDRALGLGEA